MSNWRMQSRGWWLARLPRERALLAAGAVLCGAACVYWGLGAMAAAHERAERTRDQEQRVLWRMQTRSEELLRLKAQPPRPRLSGRALQGAAANLLQRQGLPATLLQPQADGRGVRLSGQLPFERATAWLAAAQLEQGLVVRHALIEAGEAPGLVKLDVDLVPREGTP